MAKREMKAKNIPQEENTETPEIPEQDVTKQSGVGVVTNCSRLNVRKKPDVKSDVVLIINEKSTVYIDHDKSDDDWYYVSVRGAHGYCMKKYISIES